MSSAARLMAVLLATASLAVAGRVSAQLPAEAADRLRARAAEAGVPQVQLDEALVLMNDAVAQGLPPGPLEAKLLEGLAKGVPAPRLMAALRTVRSRLLRAQVLLQESLAVGVDGPARSRHVERVASALSAGVPAGEVALLGEAAGRVSAPMDRLVAAVGTLERLRGMGVYRPEAAAGIATALQAGYGPDDLARIPEDYRRHAAVGGDAQSFFGALGAGRLGATGDPGIAGTGLGRGAGEAAGAGRLPNERGGAAEGVVPGVAGMTGRGDEGSPYAGEGGDPADPFRPERPGTPDGPADPGKP